MPGQSQLWDCPVLWRWHINGPLDLSRHPMWETETHTDPTRGKLALDICFPRADIFRRTLQNCPDPADVTLLSSSGAPVHNSDLRDSHEHIKKQVLGAWIFIEQSRRRFDLGRTRLTVGSSLVCYDSAHNTDLKTICVLSDVAQIWVVGAPVLQVLIWSGHGATIGTIPANIAKRVATT